jgi:hypothetical protein
MSRIWMHNMRAVIGTDCTGSCKSNYHEGSNINCFHPVGSSIHPSVSQVFHPVGSSIPPSVSQVCTCNTSILNVTSSKLGKLFYYHILIHIFLWQVDCLKELFPFFLFNILRIKSEWLLFNTNLAIFQLYHGKNKLIFNEMMMRSACTRPTRLVGFIVLVHCCLRYIALEEESLFAWKNSIGGVLVSMFALSAVDCGFKSRSGQTKDYKIGICCFWAKHAALRRKSKD